jgi:hypothetical protein
MGLASEIALLIILLIYFSTFYGLALKKGRKYLESYPHGKDNKGYLFQFQDFSLTLAGLAVTAIALIVSIKFEGGFSSLASFTETILFFSISFVTLALSWNLIRFPKGIYHFVSGVLSDIGVLSIGCGLLVFFYSLSTLSFLPTFIIPITFGLFILVFIIFAGWNLRREISFWSLTENSEKLKSENEDKPPKQPESTEQNSNNQEKKENENCKNVNVFVNVS